MAYQQPYWNPAMETLSRQELHNRQESRLLPHIHHAYQHSALVRRVWDEAGVHPSHIRSLADFTANVPTLDKAMVRDHLPEVDHGLFQIIRYAPDMETLRLRVGFHPQDTDRLDTLQVRVASYLSDHLGLPVMIEFVPADDLLALGPPHKIPRIHEASAS